MKKTTVYREANPLRKIGIDWNDSILVFENFADASLE